ncbi:hypothetical protein CBP51_13345 [Cellvibrio mixtus]|uniref:PEP-CTERM sorting domain-containing protein n=1 Tax=Cellvibrio mixtus TaxID=39650 RepID=A0A266Q4D1_9GAMM|nr:MULTISPECIES: hypothetical protein [Cellvibrio]AQT58734.1 hypothetical protein B0D95_00470 [Cellvibrio sp. PSBB023]OZY84209.1 hypothetical protein CBP51_13345 [Cellvibrio mixtus]
MLKRILSAPVFAVLSGLLLAASAQANLIVNGGFEDNTVAAGNWSYFSSSAVNGWDGSNIEIWNNFGGVVAPEGNQHAELNAHPYTGGVFSIYQSFATVVGQIYDVSFFYSARESANESFHFSVGTLATLINDHTVGTWNQFTGSFVANSNFSTITFTTTDNSTVGNFLDAVVVTTRTSVDEASSLMMLAIGMLGLVLVRRKVRA